MSPESAAYLTIAAAFGLVAFLEILHRYGSK
jgi:hypothetical protein